MPFKLTSEQEAAVSVVKGNLQIIACAGSGKTTVVSQRIVRLIKNGALPKTIVAFTFTEKAAEELKTRIRLFLGNGKTDIGDMYIGTIHGFCFEMLKELKPEYRGYDILEPAKRMAFVSMPYRYYPGKKNPGLHIEALRRATGANSQYLPSRYTVLSRFLASYDLVRTEDIELQRLTNKDFVIACERYQDYLRKGRYLDFTEIIYRLVKTLESDPKARKLLHNKVKHLVVDEYQDVDPLQEKLIKLISVKCESLCVVGDDDQCIYNWRGSRPANLVTFAKRYPGVVRRDISHNFRSTDQVITCARNFISTNRDRLAKKMQPSPIPNNASEVGDLFYGHFPDEDSEFQFIVDRINALLGTDFVDKNGEKCSLTYRDFAILTRRNVEATKVAAYLHRCGFRPALEIGGEVISKPEVMLALNCLKFIFQVPPKDGETLVSERQLIDEYNTVFVNLFDKGKPIYPKASAKKFILEINKQRVEAQKILDKAKLKPRKDYLASGLQPYFHNVLKAFGAEVFDFEEVYNYNLAVLSRAISDYESVWKRLRASQVKYFIGFIYGYGASAYEDTSKNDPSLVDAVRIMTIHGAKGLEFPVVFLPGFVEETHRPHSKNYVDDHLYPLKEYEEDVEDERRVYYTAITRSMKYLFITGSEKRRKADGEFYKRPATFRPHHFATEILGAGTFSNNKKIKRNRSGFPPSKLNEVCFPTTFSDLNCYRRCGQDYLLRKIFGYETALPPAYGYGKNIHNILNMIFENYKRTGKVPTAQEIKTLFDKHFFLRYATSKIIDNYMAGGLKVVRNYVKLHQTSFKYILETEKRFELVQNGALITGQIDLLKQYDKQGKLKAVEVIDFKTEDDDKDPKKIYREDHELQLRLYALACLKSLGLEPKKAAIHYLNENNSNPDEVAVDKASLRQAEIEIDKVISNIKKKKFEHKTKVIDCTKCDFTKICAKKHVLALKAK